MLPWGTVQAIFHAEWVFVQSWDLARPGGNMLRKALDGLYLGAG